MNNKVTNIKFTKKKIKSKKNSEPRQCFGIWCGGANGVWVIKSGNWTPSSLNFTYKKVCKITAGDTYEEQMANGDKAVALLNKVSDGRLL